MNGERKRNGNAAAGGCPVDHGPKTGRSSKAPFAEHLNTSDASPSAGCPVKHDGGDFPFKHGDKQTPFGLPPSIEEAAKYSQSPLPDQTIPLSTRRVVSNIPRADELRPEEEGKTAPHQPQDHPRWIYPSEQQFYNAMRRKGWLGVDERTIPAVVRIHNAVNERGWNQVRQWEHELHDCDNPRLVRFLGRPNDLSPRAFVQTYVFGNRPFDRHDWFVDRGDGKEPTRYVIDFYSKEEETQRTAVDGPRMYLDVRPALDSPDAVVDRMKMFVHDAFPGIFGLYRNLSASSSSPSSTDHPNNPPHDKGP